MPLQDLNHRLARLKAELHKHPLGSGHRKELEKTVAELELKLATPSPFDPSAALGRLRDWEARLAIEHPLLSELLADVAHKLEAMGI